MAALEEAVRGYGHLELWLDRVKEWEPAVEKEKPWKLVEGWEERYGTSPALEKLRNTAVFYPAFRSLWEALTLGEEADYSQAAFWLAAAGLGSPLTVDGLDPDSTQGDRCAVPYFQQLAGPGRVELDIAQCPDLAPALAVRAALRPGQTARLVNAGRLRLKECDRLAAIPEELNKLGGQLTEGADFLEIRGVERLLGGVADSHNDHRIAMMAAIAATRCRRSVTIAGAECVAKSYPDFWKDYKSLGGDIT